VCYQVLQPGNSVVSPVAESFFPAHLNEIIEEFMRSKKTSRLSEAEFSQPCCTAIQIALVDLLQSWNIKPDGVVGHSSGEIAAAYACGAITAADAVTTAYLRGKVVRRVGQSLPGGMAAIGLGRESVTGFLKDGVVIGCENSPESVTLTGDRGALGEVTESIQNKYPEALIRILRVDCAYHSRKSIIPVEVRLLTYTRSHEDRCGRIFASVGRDP
jgi:acyl transferase domain-containing protein